MAEIESVEEYLASLPEDARAVVERIAQRVVAAAPDAVPVMRYDVPTWQVDGASLVHVAASSGHVLVYPVPPAGDPVLDRDLAPYVREKGALKFSYDEVPYELVARAVRRLREIRG